MDNLAIYVYKLTTDLAKDLAKAKSILPKNIRIVGDKDVRLNKRALKIAGHRFEEARAFYDGFIFFAEKMQKTDKNFRIPHGWDEWAEFMIQFWKSEKFIKSLKKNENTVDSEK